MDKRSFFIRMLSDHTGPSNTRVMLDIVVLNMLILANIIAWRTSQIPQIPDGWLWVIGILSGTVTTGYLATAATAFATKGGTNANQPPPA